MENKIISIDINPDNNTEYSDNAGVMWEHNATILKFNIDAAFVGDYRYYIEYRSLMGTKVRTEYLELNTEDNTVTYTIPVTMSSLKGVECWFNIVSIDDDGNTQQVIKSAKFCLSFDYSPDTDNQLCKVNDFSINALLEAIRLGTFKGDKGDKGDTGEKGDKGDKGDRGDDGEVTEKYVNKTFANALKAVLNGEVLVADDVSPVQHELNIKLTSDSVEDFSTVNATRTGKNLIPYPYKSKSQTLNGVTFTVNDDGSIYAVGTATAQAALQLANIDLGDRTVSAISAEKASVNGYTINKRLFYNADLKLLSLVIAKGDTVDEALYPQVEVGNEATEYEPYNSQTVTANADGTVDGVLSLSPNMTIFTDASEINIECEYNRDTNKVIENLVDAIILLGGNV